MSNETETPDETGTDISDAVTIRVLASETVVRIHHAELVSALSDQLRQRATTAVPALLARMRTTTTTDSESA